MTIAGTATSTSTLAKGVLDIYFMGLVTQSAKGVIEANENVASKFLPSIK